MTLLGICAAVAAAILISLFLGPYGLLVLISIIFGLVLSTHIRSKEIHSDLQRIKEKLGIEDKDDFNMSNDEIEEELEKEQLIENHENELTDLDIEIEKELENYIETDDKDNKKT
ncbi:hypothetical protein SAMN03159341_1444 [Paenibacillus sp. 1_12]|uniref:hypothetical protein n=1 Tax=Paenibacillus sp. 1_12 TaxID=1566278 RepID=UPI0008EF7E56|nr:hypothetical protein [Paenibacillus sp. 1_12]SFM53335.1 hypothetical protein SAMN03159341_1444 [Paenibacillus sp. 1_12]